MGINDRDYARDSDAPGAISIASEHPMVRNLIILTVGVFIFQLLIVRPFQTSDFEQFESNPEQYAFYIMDGTVSGNGISVPQLWLKLDSAKAQQGQVWRILTAGFCHNRATLYPIIINMVILFWLGRRLESRFGSRRFLWLYLTAIVISSIAFVSITLIRGAPASTLGATGAVLAIMMITAVAYPGERISFFGVIAVPFPVFLILFACYDLAPLIGSEQWLDFGAAQLSHLFGLAYGYFFWKTGLSIESVLPTPSKECDKSRRSSRRKNTVSQQDDSPATIPFEKESLGNSTSDELERELDRILAKISEAGRESLSAKELSTLEQASKHYSQKS